MDVLIAESVDLAHIQQRVLECGWLCKTAVHVNFLLNVFVLVVV